MDVKKIDGGALSAVPGNKGKKEEPEALDFQKLLKEAQSNQNLDETGSTPKASIGGTEFLDNSVIPISSINFAPESLETSALRSQGASAAEKALDLLDQYRQAMADPKVSLKEINPLVQSLSEEIKGLNQWTEKLPSSDPLQKITAEVGILSSVEIEKFNRGDYV